MSRRTKDRPLTDAEERTLIALADHEDDYRAKHPATGVFREMAYDAGFIRPACCRNSTTLYNLADRGLVETRERPMTPVARITDEGYRLVRSMGD
jgi:hypothetical protein